MLNVRWRAYRVACILVVALVAATLGGVDVAWAQSDGIVDELKLGVLDHGITFFEHASETGVDLNGELLFHRLFEPLDVLGMSIIFRPNLGVSIATNGTTSIGYGGLSMNIMLVRNVFRDGDGFFLDGAFDLVVHDGCLDGCPSDRKALGSRFLGRRAGEIGYQIDPQWSISAMIDHIGNYGLATPNAGLKTAGIRIGYKF
ncbi:MAG TPA: acyloxyacyl hydrolase [Stellaceae bacterium]|nr:acyloxyacyl hydrolase [Stellaceae bacterium]